MAVSVPPRTVDWEALAAAGYTGLVFALPAVLALALAVAWNRRRTTPHRGAAHTCGPAVKGRAE